MNRRLKSAFGVIIIYSLNRDAAKLPHCYKKYHHSRPVQPSILTPGTTGGEKARRMGV